MASSLVSSCKGRTKEALQFFLYQSIPGHGEVFEEVSEEDMKPGDIVLFPLENRSGLIALAFKHAAVYFGDGVVIHFQHDGSSIGRISKEGFQAMKRKRGKCCVYRKKDGIDLDDFYEKVSEVMNCNAKYHLDKNNCIHFALYLLGLVDFYLQLVSTEVKKPNEAGSVASQQSLNV